MYFPSPLTPLPCSHRYTTPLTLPDVTGPATADYAIVFVYDIFGFYPQTIQGADILAYWSPNRTYRVFIPDFLNNQCADISWYPPTDADKKAKLGAFFRDVAAPPKVLPVLREVVAELKKDYPSIEKWAAIGACWGAKVRRWLSFRKSAYILLG